MSVKFWIGDFSGNGLKTVTWCPLRTNSFISVECIVMWLLDAMGKIPRIFTLSVAQRYVIKIMRTFVFQNSVAILYNGHPTGSSLWLYKRFSSLKRYVIANGWWYKLKINSFEYLCQLKHGEKIHKLPIVLKYAIVAG